MANWFPFYAPAIEKNSPILRIVRLLLQKYINKKPMRVQVQDRTIEFLRPNASAKQEDAITPIKQEIKNQDCRKVKVVS